MKFSVLISIVIVAITAVLATLQGVRHTDLKEERTVLETRALALGLPLDGQQAGKSDAALAGGAKGTTRSGSGAASDHKAIAKEFSVELFAMARKMKEMQKAKSQPSLQEQQEMMAFFLRFMELDPQVIPHIIAELRATNEFDDDEKRTILGMSFMALAQSSPQTALDVFISSGDLIQGNESRHMVGMALSKWASDDPAAALDWIELHESDLPEKAANDARKLAIASSFQSDPNFGVQMALDLERDDLMALTMQVGSLMRTPENQLELFRSLRDSLGDLPTDPSKIDKDFAANASKEQLLRGGLLVGLGGTLASQPFEKASEFLDSAELGPVETIAVAKGIAERAGSLQDPGSWLPWIHENSLEHDRDQNVTNVIRNWTNNDFRATAAWIGEQPDGLLRERATHSFAQTVAPHEPASAAKWALTLPESERRTDLLRTIRHQWQNKDKDAADTFAAEHGLSPAPQSPQPTSDP